MSWKNIFIPIQYNTLLTGKTILCHLMGRHTSFFLQMMMDISLMKIFGGTMKLPNMTAIFSASAAYGTL